MPYENRGAGQSFAPKNRNPLQYVLDGLQKMNFTFSGGPNGYSFSGGQSALPQPPLSQRDVTNWLPYLVGGAVLFKLLK